MYLIGYDVGGTKIEAALFGLGVGVASSVVQCQNRRGELVELRVLGRRRLPTERQNGYDQIVQKMASLCRALCDEAGVAPSDLRAMGMGVPGSVCPVRQVMLAGSVFALHQRDICRDLASALGISLSIVADNDANCFALAEALGGAGIAHYRATGQDVWHQMGVGIIVGTGLGGGFVHHGQVITGGRGGAAEVGHSTLFPEGNPCYCGRQGCAEQYIAGPALEARFGQRRYSHIEGSVSAADIFRLAESHEPAAIAVLAEHKRHLARFLGNLASVLDPDYFVLGGGLSAQESLYTGLSDMLAQYAFISSARIPVYRNSLGDSAGVVGAALLAARLEL